MPVRGTALQRGPQMMTALGEHKCVQARGGGIRPGLGYLAMRALSLSGGC